MNYSAGLEFRAIAERQAGAKVQALFARHWPAYRRWFLREGDAARPSYTTSRRMLGTHMPELLPTYERLVELAGGGDKAARFLALYHPTPFLFGCSQAIWTRDRIALLRNYDYPMHRCDGVILFSGWNGTRVIAMSDCLWGVLDGINAEGLAVSLAFGGRKVVGEGFGITLILRYILEICRTTREATEVLRRVPAHMAYNVAIVDRHGDYATAFVSPDRPAIIARTPVSANSQGAIEWPEHARVTHTVVREQHLKERLAERSESLESFGLRFLQPPLYRASHHHDWGTLYTSIYYPEGGEAEYRWRDSAWHQSFDAFAEGSRLVRY